jgi:Flp pilus assembly pilin Flp
VFKKIIKDQEGAIFAEYALLAALIAIVCIVAIAAVGANVLALFQSGGLLEALRQ